jgi:GDP-L-fucose synthase
MELQRKNVLVTGGSGFLGRHVVERLWQEGAIVTVPRSSGYDLTQRADVDKLYKDARAKIVIHLAAVCGGIGANQKRPADFFYQNLMMGAHMIDAANEYGVEKFVQVGTVCSYPKHTPVPFKEENLWNGFPESTNAPYGLAKKVLLTQCQAYREQYGLNAIYLIPVNLYGPGDNFNLETSHVIPALIRKFLEAKKSGELPIIWGTGRAYREFLYVEDCADGIVKALKSYDGGDPINLGSGYEIRLDTLVDAIKGLVNYEGRVIYDPTKPDGQPRRQLDTTRAKELFGFEAKTDLFDGLRKTIEWYEKNSDINK